MNTGGSPHSEHLLEQTRNPLVGEEPIGGGNDGDARSQISEADAAKAAALMAGVTGNLMLVWCCLGAQLSLVVAKLLCRLCELSGREGDGLFWLACVAAAGLPALQVWIVTRSAMGAARRHSGSRGWADLEKERREAEEARTSRAGISDMMTYLWVDWPLMLWAFFGLTIAAAGESFIPYLYGRIIQSIAIDKDVKEFHAYMLLLVVCAAVTGLATGIRGATFIVLGARFSTRLRQALFDKLLALEVGFYDETKTGDISSRLSADCQKVGDQVELNVNVFLRSVIQLVLTVGFMYWLNWRLATLAFISVPNVVLASKMFGAFMRELTKRVQKALAESSACAEEALGSIRTIKSLHAESEMSQRYAKHMAEYRRLSYKTAAVYFPFSALTYTFLPYCASCLVLFYGGKLIHHDALKSGNLVSFVFYMQSLFSIFSTLGSIYVGLVQAVGAADKVYEWIKRPSKSSALPPGAGKTPSWCRGQLELRGVHFAYPQRPDRKVLTGLDLVAAPGKVLALCGESGGGKSSVMSLLQNWYDPQEGCVLLDGVRISELEVGWYRAMVAMVAQEPVLYARSIFENIVLGLDTGAVPQQTGEGSRDESELRRSVEEACKLANAHDFILSLPDGYDTEVGERGAQLSGGQRQRVAIARALVRRPKVLLLDEATSALDAESEYQVQAAIDGMIGRGDLTVVIIAHRLSTIRNADTIAVIGGGRVLESGTHDFLLSKSGGAYAKLAKRQMGGPPTDGTPAPCPDRAVAS